jgi:hypothetical protein
MERSGWRQNRGVVKRIRQNCSWTGTRFTRHYAAPMLFRGPELERIAAGTITLAFRRWERPRVRPGGRQRTAVGVIAFGDVRLVRTVSDEDARQAGQPSAAALLAGLRSGPGDVYRIEVCLAGPDPRVALRARKPAADELEAVRERLARMGPWTYVVLTAIGEQPGVRAADLAESLGRDKHPFKLDVRKLKELGLTESLRIGYRLSPRGRAVLRAELAARRHRSAIDKGD